MASHTINLQITKKKKKKRGLFLPFQEVKAWHFRLINATKMIDMKCQEIVEKYAKMLKILAADIYITLH